MNSSAITSQQDNQPNHYTTTASTVEQLDNGTEDAN